MTSVNVIKNSKKRPVWKSGLISKINTIYIMKYVYSLGGGKCVSINRIVLFFLVPGHGERGHCVTIATPETGLYLSNVFNLRHPIVDSVENLESKVQSLFSEVFRI